MFLGRWQLIKKRVSFYFHRMPVYPLIMASESEEQSASEEEEPEVSEERHRQTEQSEDIVFNRVCSLQYVAAKALIPIRRRSITLDGQIAQLNEWLQHYLFDIFHNILIDPDVFWNDKNHETGNIRSDDIADPLIYVQCLERIFPSNPRKLYQHMRIPPELYPRAINAIDKHVTKYGKEAVISRLVECNDLLYELVATNSLKVAL